MSTTQTGAALRRPFHSSLFFSYLSKAQPRTTLALAATLKKGPYFRVREIATDTYESGSPMGAHGFFSSTSTRSTDG